MQLFCFKCVLTLILFGLLRNKPIMWLTSIHKQWKIRQASVALLVFILILSFILPFPYICSGCAAVKSGCAAAIGFTVRPASLVWDVLLQVSIPVALGQLRDGAKAIKNVFLRHGLVVGTPVALLGPSQPKVVQLGVDALLGGRLITVGVQAIEDGAALRGKHVKGHGTLVQAQLPSLHAPDGGSSLQLVMDLDTHTPTCLSELCSHVGFPFCCMSLDLTNLAKDSSHKSVCQLSVYVYFVRKSCSSTMII